MTTGKSSLVNFVLFFLLVATPYSIVVKNHGLLFDSAHLPVLAGLAAIALTLTAVAAITGAVTVTALLSGCCLVLLVDFVTGFFDTLVFPEGAEAASGAGILIFVAFAATVLAGTWIFRKTLQTFMIAALGAVLVSTVAMAALDQFTGSSPVQRKTMQASAKKLPVYIHIILDEQQGISGFNDNTAGHKAIKTDLGEFFQRNSFKVFTRAYSQYFRTVEAVPAMLNFASVDQVGPLIQQAPQSEFGKLGTIRFTTSKNPYFDHLLQQGYRLHVYQTNWLGYCKAYAGAIAKCSTHTYTINRAALARLKFMDRARLLLRLHVSQSLLTKALLKALQSPADWSGLLGPQISFPAFDELMRDVSVAKGGDMFFAHLFMPHYPVDSTCSLRRPLVTSWLEISNHTGHSEPLLFNSPESRRERYDLYIPQVRCAMAKLETLFDVLKKRGLYDDAIIVVNGDHGSRIVINKPLMDNKDVLKPQDFYDGFSALFAVKMPGVAATRDQTMITLSHLLKMTAAGPDGLNHSLVEDGNPQVYLHRKETEAVRGKMTAFPMPPLPKSALPKPALPMPALP
jgi:hypothetical protein